jgi:hypothetical protein
MSRSVARYLGIGRGGGQQIIGLGLSVVVGAALPSASHAIHPPGIIRARVTASTPVGFGTKNACSTWVNRRAVVTTAASQMI